MRKSGRQIVWYTINGKKCKSIYSEEVNVEIVMTSLRKRGAVDVYCSEEYLQE